MRSSEVVEALPFVQFRLQIDIAFIAEELIKFLLVGSVGSLNFAIELWRAPLDVGMSNALVLYMPLEFGLELVAIVSSNFANAERKLLNDMINEVDRVCLCVFVIDLQSPDARCVVDCCVLVSVVRDFGTDGSLN